MNRNNITDPQVPYTTDDMRRCEKHPRYAVRYGMQWERNVYKGFHDCVEAMEDGWVIRLYKPRYSAQVIDILVDGVDGEYYGVECKSTTKYITYPTKWFGKAPHEQLTEETVFLRRTGRVGVIAFLMPTRDASRHVFYRSYLIPWPVYIQVLYGSGRVTAGDLDALATMGLIVKIGTNNGIVKLSPDVFHQIQVAMQTFENEREAAQRTDFW